MHATGMAYTGWDGMMTHRRPRSRRFGLSSIFAALTILSIGAGALAAPPVRNSGSQPTLTPIPLVATNQAVRPLPPSGIPVESVAPDGNADIRPRPPQRPFANPVTGPGAAGAHLGVTAGTPTRPRLRLDDPVLRWLPEILDAAERTGTPPSLIAAVIYVESTGDPYAISPAGARGLMQIMPDELRARDIPRARWHDPATNIRVGAGILAERRDATGSWQGAVSHYFGIGCDAHGTCTTLYVRRVFSHINRYARIMRNPTKSGIEVLPANWRPPDPPSS